MDFFTKHEEEDQNKSYGLWITEDVEIDGESYVNTAEVVVCVDNYIDSRSELRLEIKKRSLEFLKRTVEQLESELKG